MNKIFPAFLLAFAIILCACDNKNESSSTNTEISGTSANAGNGSEDASDSTEESTTPAPKVETSPWDTTGLKRLDAAKGDLNKDGKDEMVVVFDNGEMRDMGTEREIHILKDVDGNWELWKKSIGAVLPSDHGGMMGDPFQGVLVERGCLVVSHFGGSRWKWSYVHRWRFQNNDWELIGATIEFGAHCEEWKTYDFNLSTGDITLDMKIEECPEDDIIVKEKIKENFSHKMNKLPKLDGFYPGDNEINLGSEERTFYY